MRRFNEDLIKRNHPEKSTYCRKEIEMILEIKMEFICEAPVNCTHVVCLKCCATRAENGGDVLNGLKRDICQQLGFECSGESKSEVFLSDCRDGSRGWMFEELRSLSAIQVVVHISLHSCNSKDY
ncbi:hypothetical protein C5167_014036 [Papaver somniferum]|uniref:Uncharacterized protein n=1 Tax=Papaver somniferum TaxID=3469 RepID=A0A4Y7J635_PAPSO|nr:hypothetical protein C5167_014036 [Papaver somniferum]